MYSFRRVGRIASRLLACTAAFALACSDASNPNGHDNPSGPATADASTTVARVVVLVDSATLAPGHTSFLHGYALNAAGDTLAVSGPIFSSSNAAVLTVVPGKVTAIKAGTANAQITVGGVMGFATVTVAAPVGPATHLSIATQPGGAASGANLAPQPVVQVRDANQNLVKTSNAPVTVTLGGAGGTLAGTTTRNAVNGVATFTDLHVTGPGSYTLRFASGALAAATSNAITISQPAGQGPASLALQTQPGGATTGSAMTTQPVVQILDATGVVLASSVLPVTATRTTGNGILTGTTTVNAVAGIATFTDLRLDGSGNNVLTFSIATPALSVASAGFNVAVGPPAQLVMRTQPVGGASGVALPTQPVVEIRDVANQLTASALAVTTTIATGTGVLAGPTTVNAVNGVATFAGLVITGGGNYSLKFTTVAPALNVTSGVFSVGGGGGGGGTTITSLSRDGGSSAGGAVVTITGTGFGATDQVQFAGTNATNVVFISATTLQATVPPGVATNMSAPTAINVSVIHNGVTVTLPSSFTYWPAPTNILATAGFEDGTMGSFTTVVPNNNVIVNTKSHTGTHSLHSFASGPSQNDQISWARTQDDIVGGPGRWHRWYLLIPAATLAATANQGQIKLFLSRTGLSKGFVTLGEGWEFNSNDNELASRVDFRTLIIHTGPQITADAWHEVQVYEYRDPVAHVGTALIWYEGKLVGQRTTSDLGDDDATLLRAAVFGAVYTQNASAYPLDVYVDDIKIGNGYIDPTP